MRGRDSRLRALAVAVVLAAVPAAAAPRTIQERLGHPPDARLIVIHADDLGMAHSVNRATFEALEQGWITSASILVPCPWFPEVARWARAHPEADLGIHLALTSEWTGLRWRPLSAAEQVPSLLDADGYLPLVESTVAQRALPQEAERELRAQIERAKAAGIRFTHFDSHMNALFLTPALRDLYTRLAREHQVPLRWAKGLAGPDGGSVPADQVLLDGIVAVNPGVDPEELAGRVPEAAGPAAARRLRAGRPPGLRRRGDVGRDRRPPRLGRRLAALRPRPGEEPGVPPVPEGPSVRAGDVAGACSARGPCRSRARPKHSAFSTQVSGCARNVAWKPASAPSTA